MKLEFLEHPLRCFMDLVDLGARSKFLADLKLAEIGRFARKIGRGSVF